MTRRNLARHLLNSHANATLHSGRRREFRMRRAPDSFEPRIDERLGAAPDTERVAPAEALDLGAVGRVVLRETHRRLREALGDPGGRSLCTRDHGGSA